MRFATQLRNGLETTALVSFFAMLTPAWAQTTDERSNVRKNVNEIVVTARFREERDQDIGQSITAFSGQMLEDAGIEDFADIARRTPGLDFSDLGPNRNTPRIRGISNPTPLLDNQNTPALVSGAINDVPITSIGFNQLSVYPFDLQRVEVLKGPQGTFFGEGAAGGTIRYFLQPPTLGEFEGKIQGSYSSIKDGGTGYSIAAAASVPIGETAAIRITGYRRDMDGYIDNSLTGQEDVNSFDTTGARINLLFEPTKRLSLNAFAIFEDTDVGGTNIVLGGPPEDLIDARPGPDSRTDEYMLIGGRATYEFDNFEVTSITGYYDRDYDADYFSIALTGVVEGIFNFSVPPAFLNLPPDVPFPVSFPITLDQSLATESFTQELRIISDLGGRIEFTGGLFFRDGEFNSLTLFTSPTNESLTGDPLFDTTTEIIENTQISVFGNVSFDVTDQITLLAGGRYFNDTIKSQITDVITLAIPVIFPPFEIPLFPPAPDTVTDEIKISTFLPSAALEFRPTEDILLYANYSEGARNGGVNSEVAVFPIPDPAARADARTYEEDRVRTVEIGAKTQWLDGRLTLNAAGYYSNWSDVIIIMLDPASQLAFFENGPDARIIGAELASLFEVNDYISLFLSGNYTDAQFTQMLNTGIGIIMDGAKLPYVPDYTLNVGMDARYPLLGGDVFGRVDFQHVGRSVNSVTRQDPLDSYGLLDLQLGYEQDNWRMSLFVNNAFNNIVAITRARELSLASVNRPRVIGVRLAGNF